MFLKGNTKMNDKYELVKEMSIKDTDGTRLYRIRALRDIYTNHGIGEIVHKGDLGGFVQNENNLSIYSEAWAFDDSIIRDNAILRERATIHRGSMLCGNALVGNEATIKGSYVCGNATVVGHSVLIDSMVSENAVVGGFTELFKAKALGNASVFNTQQLVSVSIDDCIGRMYKVNEERDVSKYLMIPEGNMFRIMALRDIDNFYRPIKKGEYGGLISSSANLSQSGECWIFDNSIVSQNATVQDNAAVAGNSEVLGNSVICEHAFVKDSIIYNRAFIGGGSKVENCKIGRFVRILGDTTLKGRAENALEIFSKTKNVLTMLNNGDIYYLKQDDRAFVKNF